ncbi:hypothetical protein BC629DRAFT_400074 [Irpex lacteus]|nr:hypothetical protein BC629DRAFT_400074 [Irpex lacteus]
MVSSRWGHLYSLSENNRFVAVTWRLDIQLRGRTHTSNDWYPRSPLQVSVRHFLQLTCRFSIFLLPSKHTPPDHTGCVLHGEPTSYTASLSIVIVLQSLRSLQTTCKPLGTFLDGVAPSFLFSAVRVCTCCPEAKQGSRYTMPICTQGHIRVWKCLPGITRPSLPLTLSIETPGSTLG